MRFRKLQAAVASLALTAITAVPVLADTPAEIMQKFIGTWDIDEGVNMGVPIPDDELEGSTSIVTKDTIVTYDKAKSETYRAKYTLNTQTDPMQIDMVSERNGQKRMALGIIKFEWLDLDGEQEVTLAYSLKKGERPAKFESPKGSMIMLLELEELESDD